MRILSMPRALRPLLLVDVDEAEQLVAKPSGDCHPEKVKLISS